MFKNKFPQNLYHSYVIEGDPDILSKELLSFLEENKYITKSDDVISQIYDGFSISDSPVIKEWHSVKGEEDRKRICVIGAKFVNQEAEHSLLKILEEPALNTHFFLIVPNVDVLLPTILSRVHVIRLNESNDFNSEFLKASVGDRLEMIGGMIKRHENDEDSASLRYEAINFLNNLERSIYKDIRDKEAVFSLGEILNAKKYLSIPGASVKMLLEHIAIVV